MDYIKTNDKRELALFAGIGGGILAGKLLNWRTVCAVERDAYAISVLVARQNDKVLPFFPIWDDIQTFNGKEWRGCVDIISGGFPCQDISVAGKGVGITGRKSSMWFEMERIISEIRPKEVFVENTPMLIKRGLTRVISGLTKMGYDTKWCVLGADDLGFNHRRKRIWILSTKSSKSDNNDSLCHRIQRSNEKKPHKQPKILQNEGVRVFKGFFQRRHIPKPLLRRMADGLPNGVDKIRGIGNAQVPSVASRAYQILSEEF